MSKDLQQKFKNYLDEIKSQEQEPSTVPSDQVATPETLEVGAETPAKDDASGIAEPNGQRPIPPEPFVSIQTEVAPAAEPISAPGVTESVHPPILGLPEPSPLSKVSKAWWLGGSFLLLLLGAGILLVPKLMDTMEQWQEQKVTQQLETEPQNTSEVFKLINLPPGKRDEQLKMIASQSQESLERSRARYLLATDLLAKFEGGKAVRWLENLENDYPVLAPYILLKRGRGYALSNEKIRATETWQEILTKHSQSSVKVDALYELGKSDPKYWQEAIADYPHHPRTLDILLAKLKQKPDSVALMRQIITAAPDNPRTYPIRDRLLKQDTAQLTPDDWQGIADSFWAELNFEQALKYYAKTPQNAQNLYRLARSQQIKGKKAEAIANYRLLIQKYPDSKDTAKGITRFATLIPATEAASYLDQVIQRFPEQAPAVLSQKAKLLKTVDGAAAARASQTLLKNYSSSNEAAEYRWRRAKELAKAGEITQAWQWAQQIAEQNPDSDEAPKAIFWIGKWAQQLNRPDDAKAAFENVLSRYPQSYFAWRSAVLLGWQVGDFNSVRFLNPPVNPLSERPLPPAGSPMFKELYRLGLDKEAIAVFAAETNQAKSDPNQSGLNVNEQFTQALLKLAQSQYLGGINQILDLRNPTDPEQYKQWRSLREKPEYWQALFPFPYQPLIFNWAQKRQLNPFLVTALIRQESRFEKDIRSPVGATGLMQVMPATADWIAPQIGLKKFSLTDINDNLNMGTWYFDHTHKTYNNNSALAVASYNAGPGNVQKWLKAYEGSDPDGFIEKIPFPETKGYVESVFANYWNYLRIYDPDVAQLLSRLPR
ncbi:MAG: transglycosylase SLT domain-containing protein [Microcystaceae cyanobacterium]